MSVMCGGLGEAQDVDKDIMEMCQALQADIEKDAGKTFNTFTPISYCSQVVAGTNFFVKIGVDGDYIHVRIFKPLPHTGEKPSFKACQTGKKADDTISYFD